MVNSHSGSLSPNRPDLMCLSFTTRLRALIVSSLLAANQEMESMTSLLSSDRWTCEAVSKIRLIIIFIYIFINIIRALYMI